jgi:hypothetical protein
MLERRLEINSENSSVKGICNDAGTAVNREHHEYKPTAVLLKCSSTILDEHWGKWKYFYEDVHGSRYSVSMSPEKFHLRRLK